MADLNLIVNWVIARLTDLFNACSSGAFGLLGFAFIGFLIIRQLAKVFKIFGK